MMYELQSAVVEKLKVLFAEKIYKSKKGEAKLQVFKQTLPENLYESDPEYCPYIIVKLMDGTDNLDSDQESITGLTFMICTYDAEFDNQGTQDVLNIINDVRLGFLSNPYCGKFRMTNLSWLLDETEYAPYYLGWVDVDWKSQGIRLENDEFS